MADQIRVVSFTTPAATGTFDITHPELTETFKAAIFLVGFPSGADNADINHGIIGLGFIGVDNAAPENASVSASWQHNVGLANNHGLSDNDDCIIVLNTAGSTVVVRANYDSTIANGVRINFSTVTSGVQCNCIAILFGGLDRASCGDHSTNSTGTSETVGDIADPFTPDLVIFACADLQVDTTINDDGILRLGFALNKAGLPQVCGYLNSLEDAATTDSDAIVRSDAAWFAFESDRVGSRAQVTAFDANGFDMIADDGSPQSNYLAIKWSNPSAVRYAVANMSVAASTGIQSFNDFGFTPDVVFGMSTLLAAVDTLTDGSTASSGGHFVTGRYGSRAHTVHLEEGVTLGGGTNTNAHTRQEDVALLNYGHTGTVVHRATWAGGTGSGGFKLDFSVASQVGLMTALGIQIIPTETVPRRRRLRRATRTRRALRRTVTHGVAAPAATASSLFWRAIQRIRKGMQRRLRWRPRPELPLGVEVPFPATGQDAEGGVFVAGADRAQILSGGAEEGAVL